MVCTQTKCSDDIYENVQNYYGKVLQNTKDLKTSACCTDDKPHKLIREAISKIPQIILSKFYGCGNPIPLGIKGLDILDLGCGSGRDCYIASKLVGPEGTVTGIDMTSEQIDLAIQNAESFTKELKYANNNMKFVKGHIEYLEKAGIKEESVDIVISNCVVNLSPDKEKVLQGVFKSLKRGGEFYFSDIYCDRRLPENVRQHKLLFGECISGALYKNDFIRLCHKVGFTDPRVLSEREVTIEDEDLKNITGEARFYSITYRLFKLDNLETLCEDYGQVAIYKGNIEGCESSYRLDDHHVFETNRPVLVCGNSSSMVGESWLSPYFTIIGSRQVHYGQFDCSNVETQSSQSNTKSSCC
ncbi:S-adenosylmethionine [Acrasis kona]|uniref:Arsenite methyltransferase n=1 Tax=Acrasis kona TaxID=1008807 RepID=A0AAW2YTG3_9EUKA